MGYRIESFLKIEVQHINRFATFQTACPVVHGFEKLRVTGSSGSEPMLAAVEQLILHQVSHQAVSYEGLQNLAGDGGQTYRSIVSRILSAAFFEDWYHCAQLPIARQSSSVHGLVE